MSDNEHEDQFDVFMRTIQESDSRSAELIEESPSEKKQRKKRQVASTTIDPGKEKREKSSECRQFSIFLSCDDHKILSDISFLTGKSISKQVRECLEQYCEHFREWKKSLPANNWDFNTLGENFLNYLDKH